MKWYFYERNNVETGIFRDKFPDKFHNGVMIPGDIIEAVIVDTPDSETAFWNVKVNDVIIASGIEQSEHTNADDEAEPIWAFDKAQKKAELAIITKPEPVVPEPSEQPDYMSDDYGLKKLVNY